MDRKFIKGYLGAIGIFIALLIEQTQSQQGLDLTLVPEAFNTSVVDATVQKINQLTELNDDLQPDNRFIRRIAWVETEDGTAPRTYSDPAYHGGIWRVNQSVYDATTRMFNMAEYSSIFFDIEKLFCISWSQTTWDDCRKPLYSALTARLFVHNLNPVVPLGLADQAERWVREYNDQPSDTAENFTRKVQDLEASGCNVRGIDLVFVLDGSGSVGPTDFTTTKNFVAAMVDVFNIGIDQTRVGVIQYSSGPRTEFYMNQHTNDILLKEAIAGITYLSGGTRTGAALDFMSSTSFLPENGGRPPSRGFPRVAVVITDGRSGDSVSPAAERARDMDIVIFAIGVTGAVDILELNEIANKPSDAYVFSVSNFDAIANIGAALEYETCDQATTLENETVSSTLNTGQMQNFQLPLTNNGVTVRVEASNGTALAYISTTTPNPNEALYDFRLLAMEGFGPVEVFIGPGLINRTCTVGGEGARKRRQASNQDDGDAGTQIGTVYMTIEGLQDTNDFVLIVTEGDVTEPTTTTKAIPTNGCSFVATTAAHVAMLALNTVFATQLMKTAQ